MKTPPTRISFAPLILACAVAVAVTTTTAHAQIPCGGYEVTAIIQAPECPPFGFPPTIGTAISEPIDGGLPNVVGYYQSCTIGPPRAFLWIGNEDRFITVPMPPGTLASGAFDIAGTQIVGTFDLSGDGLSGLGFLYDFQTDEFTNLGTLPGGTRSEALAVNTAGQIAGYWSNKVVGPWQAFIWEDGVMNDLGPLIGGAGNRALDINEKGAITGWWRREEGGERIAFIWQDDETTDLGPVPGGFSGDGRAINKALQVTMQGKIRTDDGIVVRAFLWDDAEFTDLGTLPVTTFARPTGMSDQGAVVGYCHNAGLTNQTAFVWQDGVMTALNDLVPPEPGLDIKIASAINSAGQIIAYGEDSKSDVVSSLLTPIKPPLGDLDGDCTVGVLDLLFLLTSWGPCDSCDDCRADLNGDCVVGVVDLLILLGNWG